MKSCHIINLLTIIYATGVKFLRLESYCVEIFLMMKVLALLVTILVLAVAASIKEELCEDCGPVAERLTLAQEEFPIQPLLIEPCTLQR